MKILPLILILASCVTTPLPEELELPTDSASAGPMPEPYQPPRPKTRAEKKKAWEKEVRQHAEKQRREKNRQLNFIQCYTAHQARRTCMSKRCAYDQVEKIDKKIAQHCKNIPAKFLD